MSKLDIEMNFFHRYFEVLHIEMILAVVLADFHLYSAP